MERSYAMWRACGKNSVIGTVIAGLDPGNPSTSINIFVKSDGYAGQARV
jgi:hypothetical protein